MDHPKRGTIIGIFERLSRALARYQEKESGLWFQVLDQGFREGNYLETSGSSMFIYALAKGARLQYLEQPSRPVAERAYEGLIQRFVEAGETGVRFIPYVMEQGSAMTATARMNITSVNKWCPTPRLA